MDRRCFKIDNTKRIYANSVEYCKSQGANIASIHSDKENNAAIRLLQVTAYIGAESDGKGNWTWNDGSKWWQPDDSKHDGIVGKTETKIALNTADKKWHDWTTGSSKIGVLCAMPLAKPKPPGKILMNGGTRN